MGDTIIIRREDRLGRPARVDVYGPGDPLPEWADDLLAGRETRALDRREEVKHCGGPWYKLPGGEKVRGREAVYERGYKPPS
jgi:hypothetical protein